MRHNLVFVLILTFLLSSCSLSYQDGRKSMRRTVMPAPSYVVKKNNQSGNKTNQLLTLGEGECYSYLGNHNVEFEKLEHINDVRMPVQIQSPLGGVRFIHTGRSKKFSVMDCRLAASLIGWASVLKQFGITEVHHMRAYTPNATVGGGRTPSGHSWAMAIDASTFKTENGEDMVVINDWSDRRSGIDPCQPGQKDKSEKQKILREIVCTTAEQNLFQLILTPHYNKAHHDHLHIEISENQPVLFLR